jgi:branched-chain amino acid transport system substrate-binding protein
VVGKATGEYMTGVAKKAYFLGPNYQAGWDWIGGGKSGFKGTIVNERFFPITTLDFSSEIAQVRASGADGLYAFMVGSGLVAFVKQYDQSGIKARAPLYGGMYLADDLVFDAEGDAALGIVMSTHWYSKMDNPSNARFVASFRAKYGRNPAMYAQQQYDAIMLIDNAVMQVNGKIEDKAAFRNALRQARFQSTRGSFRFGNNQFPIQDFYMVKVAKNADGRLEHQLIGQAMKDAQDSFHDQCPMKW